MAESFPYDPENGRGGHPRRGARVVYGAAVSLGLLAGAAVVGAHYRFIVLEDKRKAEAERRRPGPWGRRRTLLKRKTKALSPRERAQRWFWILLFSTALVLAITAFYGVLVRGALDGWLLFLHLLAAGPFLILLGVFAVTAAWQHRGARLLEQLVFVVVVISALLTLVPILLSMFPYFATDAMLAWLEVHRYAGLALVISLAVDAYLRFVVSADRK